MHSFLLYILLLITEALLGISKRKEKYIPLPMLNGLELFEIEKIIYIKAENTQSSLIMEGEKGKIVVNKKLKEFEELLADYDFIRIHRSYLINYNHLRKYIKGKGGIAVMSNKDELNIAKDQKEYLLKRMEWAVKDHSGSQPVSSVSHPKKADSQFGA